MHEKVREYLDEVKEKELLKRGLYEKVYYEEKDVTEEMKSNLEYDYINQKYYKKVPYQISDEDFEKLLRIFERKEESTSSAFYFISVIIFLGGSIGGIIAGQPDSYYGFSWGAAFIVWLGSFLLGMIYIGIGKIISLLNDIKNK